MGGNQILEIPSGIKELSRLRFLYLGGNLLRRLPAEICRLEHLRALTLCNNRLEMLPGNVFFFFGKFFVSCKNVGGLSSLLATTKWNAKYNYMWALYLAGRGQPQTMMGLWLPTLKRIFL